MREEVPQLLQRWSAGGELRRLERSAPRRDRHEVWLRPAAKKIMRDVLADRMRRRQAAKRGGIQIEVPLEDASPSERPRQIEFPILAETPRTPRATVEREYSSEPIGDGARL